MTAWICSDWHEFCSKKLWLIDRNAKAQAKTKHIETAAPASNTGNAGDGLQLDGDAASTYPAQPQRPMSALEKREMMLKEREEQIKLRESIKLHKTEMMKKEKEAEIRKRQHQAQMRMQQKENALVLHVCPAFVDT